MNETKKSSNQPSTNLPQSYLQYEVNEFGTNPISVPGISTPTEVDSTSIPSITSTKKPPKAREVSMVWEHFTKENVGDNIKAVCKYCKKKMSGHYKHGTSHLRHHYEHCPRRSQLTLRQTILKNKKKEDGDGDGELQAFVPNSFDRNKAREKMAKIVVMHELPISFVEYEAFRDFVDYVQPLVGTLSRNTLRKQIFNLYASEKSKVALEIENCGSRVAITTDMWTSSNQKKATWLLQHTL